MNSQMNSQSIGLLIGMAALLLSSCAASSDEKFTMVEGTVVNKYTGQPVAGTTVSVLQFIYGAFGNTSSDSVIATRTDAAGRYSLSFNGRRGFYRIKVRDYKNFYDLTNYPDYNAQTDGMETALGSKNKINFEVTPYKLVTVNINSSKVGKSDIHFGFANADVGSYLSGTILSDTVRANQLFTLTKVIQLVPNRVYQFSKLTANRVSLGGYRYEFRDRVQVNILRSVLYNDTTTINIR